MRANEDKVFEPFRAAWINGDAGECTRLLTSLPESERRKILPPLNREVEIWWNRPRNASDDSNLNWRIWECASILLYGSATLGEIKRSKVSRFAFDSVESVLANRNPEWLQDWVAYALETNPGWWQIVRNLIRQRLIVRPPIELYTLGMIGFPRHRGPLQDVFASDPELLQEDIWLIFEVEGNGENSLAAVDKYTRPEFRWSTELCKLAAENKLSRERLLNSTLQALGRDFAPFRAGWFARFYEQMEPSPAEIALHADQLLGLLSSQVPATVSFAMKHVLALHKLKKLPLTGLEDRLAPALSARDKGTVLRALSIYQELCTSPSAAARVARALAHESTEVQRAALDLIGDNSGAIDPYRSTLAPSVLAQLDHRSASPQANTSKAKNSAQAAAAPESRVLPANSAIQPIESDFELVECISAALESLGPPDLLERVLDALPRLKPDERLTKSLVTRARRHLSGSGFDLQRPLARLVLAWATREPFKKPESESSLADFMLWRLWHLGEILSASQPGESLALPTSKDGRIESTVLDARISRLTPKERKTRASNRESPWHLDWLIAEMRCGRLDRLTLPKHVLHWETNSWVVDGKTYTHQEPQILIPDLKLSRYEPAHLHLRGFFGSLPMAEWCATLSPHWREAWFASGCKAIGDNLDWWSADWGNRGYLLPLLDPHTEITSLGGLLLALGLAAKEAGEAATATEALQLALNDGRLGAEALSRALDEALASKAVKPPRWVKPLMQVASSSPHCAQIICDSLESILQSKTHSNLRGFPKLKELANEIRHLIGRASATQP